MIRLLVFLAIAAFFTACETPKDQSNNGETTPTQSTEDTGKIETEEQMLAMVDYSTSVQDKIFRMIPTKTLPYYIDDHEFRVELYKDENGDTLAMVSNGDLVKYGERDTYLFYKENKPRVLFMDNLKKNAYEQKYRQRFAFFDNNANMMASALIKEAQLKEELASKKLLPKDLGQAHKAHRFSQEFNNAFAMEKRYKLYFKEIFDKDGRKYVRFKTNSGMDVVANSYQSYVRIPKNITDNTLKTIMKNPKNFVGKPIKLEWAEVKDPDGRTYPEWVSAEVIAE